MLLMTQMLHDDDDSLDVARPHVVRGKRFRELIIVLVSSLVLATGMSGKANWPKYNGQDIFKGEQQHSSQHPGPDAYVGKKTVVIGSNTSAHDITGALDARQYSVTPVAAKSATQVLLW